MERNTFQVGKSTIRLIKGDITEMLTEAIVNAANSTLMGGGGVDGAIHRKGGTKILDECKRIRATQYPDGLPTGKAVITGAGNLQAKKVIHTVGPIWRGGNYCEPELLGQAYLNSLKLLAINGLQTIAFPSISTGAYGYPVKEASRVALQKVKEFLLGQGESFDVVFVLFSFRDLEVYRESASEILENSHFL
jgi:O-acetyl-ADP-ribose deacetylase (regulator of RNase III)